MKEVLEYTREELEKLSKDDLKVLFLEATNKESLYNTRQLVEKTLMNSLYGAMANRWFALFNEDMAAAITGNGRYFIRKLAIYIENTLQKLLPQEKPYITYGDTDSCVGSTLIQTNLGKTKIEDLYNNLPGEIEERNSDNFIKHIKTDIKTPSISNSKELQFKNISYVMKHKVKKRMFKIKCQEDEVIITEDHSIVVLRDNKLIECKPNNLQTYDKIIKI